MSWLKKYSILLILLLATGSVIAGVNAKPLARLYPKPFPVYKINFEDDLTTINADLLKKYNRDSSYFETYMRFYYPMLTIDWRQLIPINIPFTKKIEGIDFKKKTDLTILLNENLSLLVDYKHTVGFGSSAMNKLFIAYMEQLIEKENQRVSNGKTATTIQALFTINFEAKTPNGDIKKLIFNTYSSYSRFIKAYYEQAQADGVAKKALKKFEYSFNIVRNDWVEYTVIDSVNIITP